MPAKFPPGRLVEVYMGNSVENYHAETAKLSCFDREIYVMYMYTNYSKIALLNNNSLSTIP